ncbi:MAG TPA: acyl--CoA ligase family protein [Chloroflexota bacterium]|nr:acyl--CoA ligase family protein [Chloroflexota bacterium]
MAHELVYRTELTPLLFLERSADVFHEKPAVVYSDASYTYPELRRRVRRLASALAGVGVRKGDRVAIICPNIPPMLEAHYGIPLAGAIMVPINTRLSADEIGYILNHSGAKVLLVDTELAPTVERCLGQLEIVKTIVSIVDRHLGTDAAPRTLDGAEYEAFLETGSEAPIAIPVEDEYETISINYTSGTTGRPKGVMVHHRGAYLNAIGECMTSGIVSDSRYLWTLPMFHCNGWCCTWGVTAVGGTHVCLRRVDPGEIWRLILDGGVTHLNGAPTVLIGLVNHPAAKTAKLSRPLRVTTAAAPPSPSIIGQMQALGAEITHVYGLTETYGPHTVCEWQEQWNGLPPEEQARKKARQGVGYLIAEETRVVDENMQDVPSDGETMGEVVMRGNNVMTGYYQRPEDTAEAFRGGWFHSGDLAVRHPDGYIELRDRAKDIIISGGENISTIEVERCIYQHPAVLEVAVIAIPDERWGEVPKAFVTLKEGESVGERELIDFCRDRIAHFKAPKAIEFGELPKTSTGKVQKFVLRDREWGDRAARIN